MPSHKENQIVTGNKPSSARKKVLRRVVFILFIFGFVVSLGISEVFNKTRFRAYGRSFSVPQDGLKVICVDDLDLKKTSPDVGDLEAIMPELVRTCGDNFNAQVFYGNGEVYDMRGRSSSEFKPGEKYLLALQQPLGNRGGQTKEWILEYRLLQDEKADVRLTIYNMQDNFEKIYSEDLGKMMAFRNAMEESIQFKDVDKDGILDAQVMIPLAASIGYKVFFYKKDGFRIWTTGSHSLEQMVNPSSYLMINMPRIRTVCITIAR